MCDELSSVANPAAGEGVRCRRPCTRLAPHGQMVMSVCAPAHVGVWQVKLLLAEFKQLMAAREKGPHDLEKVHPSPPSAH